MDARGEIGDEDAGAPGEERLGDGPADAAGASGHDRDGVRHLHGFSCSPVAPLPPASLILPPVPPDFKRAERSFGPEAASRPGIARLFGIDPIWLLTRSVLAEQSVLQKPDDDVGFGFRSTPVHHPFPVSSSTSEAPVPQRRGTVSSAGGRTLGTV
ncbi:hypothetical protein GCM10009755_13770 [Brevibacterium samyangense]|uniref:Uncharacterized protein n=1 Tax=Brevibacterium samyangense TaxID=366888 RepID=A0ABN2TDQ9_9MICO